MDLDFVGNVGYEENFEERVDTRERSKKAREILATLDKFDRELIVLRYFEDMSFRRLPRLLAKKKERSESEFLEYLRV